MVDASTASPRVHLIPRPRLWPCGAAAAVVLALYADGWAHNHGIQDTGWWGWFPSRPGPPHFPVGLSLWHLPYLGALAWAGLLAAAELRAGDPRGRQTAGWRLLAVLAALAGWLVGTVLPAARTPGAAFLRLESLPGLVGPAALLQAGGVVYLAWRVVADAAGGWVRAVGAGLVLSGLAFLTQFAHPYVDPWPSAGFLRTGLQTYRYGLFYFGESMGVLSLLLQGCLAAAVLVAVRRTGPLPPGGWTVAFGGNGALLGSLRDHYAFVPAALVVGLVADALAARAREGHPHDIRVLASGVAGVFCASTIFTVGQMGAVDVLYGTGGGFALPEVWGLGWSVQLWLGTSLLAGAGGWLVAALAEGGR